MDGGVMESRYNIIIIGAGIVGCSVAYHLAKKGVRNILVIEQDKFPMVVTATMLHHIGKTMVPLKILNKPGPFESHELEEMRRHALYSGEILREAGGGLRRGDSHCHPAPRDDGRHWLSPGAKR